MGWEKMTRKLWNENTKEGIKTLEKATKLGDDIAAWLLYSAYCNGEDGFTKNKDKAKKYLEIAAKRGKYLSCYDLGVHYYYGK